MSAPARFPVAAADDDHEHDVARSADYEREVREERERCRYIVTSPAARGRYAAAVALAATDMHPEDAVRLLACLPSSDPATDSDQTAAPAVSWSDILDGLNARNKH